MLLWTLETFKDLNLRLDNHLENERVNNGLQVDLTLINTSTVESRFLERSEHADLITG